MELNFAKTAPGVMTASWTRPKKGRQHSIAIIESCDTQHLFIDGELIARDLPAFDDAVTLAKEKLNGKRSPQLVRIAGALVVASIIGASVVVASKFIPAISPAKIAAAASPAESGETKPAGQQRQATTQKTIPAKSEAVTTATMATKPPLSAASAPEQAQSSTHLALSAPEPAAPPSDAGTGEGTNTAETTRLRRFSARYSLLALEARLAKQRAPARQETTDTTAPRAATTGAPERAHETAKQSAVTAPPAALATAAPPTPTVETSLGMRAPATDVRPSNLAEATSEVTYAKPLIRPMIPQYTDAGEIETAQSAATPSGPPLPARAPIRTASLDTEAAHDAPPVNEDRAATAQSKVTAKPKPFVKHRPTARRTPKSRRLPRRTRRTSPRRVVTAGPQKRLVCFAHVCRWR